jgi:hypothetical protein
MKLKLSWIIEGTGRIAQFATRVNPSFDDCAISHL